VHEKVRFLNLKTFLEYIVQRAKLSVRILI
jgi:hypothetical protein